MSTLIAGSVTVLAAVYVVTRFFRERARWGAFMRSQPGGADK